MKKIYLTSEEKEDLIRRFTDYVSSARMIDEKITFSGNIDSLPSKKKSNDKALVVFTTRAFLKIKMLVDEFKTEVAWNGTVKRISKNKFLVYDIFVYPQTVTGATVKTDELKIQEWISSLDDEIYNSISLQGHSHVDMPCKPSGTDLDLQRIEVNQLTDDMFYIYQICNKKGEMYLRIFDMENNIQYEDNDILYQIEDEVLDFLDDAKDKVKRHSYSSTPSSYGSWQQSLLDNGNYGR